jgi:hypothetical protein
MNEKNIFSLILGFSRVVRLLARIRADCEFFTQADSFNYESGYSRRCRGAATASAISD